ncbi:MAG: hypothetical protein AAF439_07880, partial [Pseudomonadota bacterium]
MNVISRLVAAMLVFGIGGTAVAEDQDSFRHALMVMGNKSSEAGNRLTGTAINFPAPCTVFVRYTVIDRADELQRSWLFKASALTEVEAVDGDEFGVLLKGDKAAGGPKITMSQRQTSDGKITRGNRHAHVAAMNFPLSREDLP